MKSVKIRVPLKVLIRRAEQLTWHYHIAQVRQSLGPIVMNQAENGEIASYSEEDNVRIIKSIEMALDLLEEEHRTFVVKDFLDYKYPFWWQDQFSRSSYYRIKHRALEQFTGLFFEK